MSKIKRNHFNSRFVTQPWEFGTRNLWCYDFETNQLSIENSYGLFSKRKIFSQITETRYRDLIETPLAQLVHPLRQTKIDIGKWSIQRAAYLFFLAQGPRVNQAIGTNKELDNFFSKSDAELDALVGITMKASTLRVHTAEPGKRFFFPGNGVFTLAVPDGGCPSKFTFCFGLPISPIRALLIVSDTVQESDIAQVPIADFSVGLPGTSRYVVLPPEGRGTEMEKQIASNARLSRRACKILIRDQRKARDLNITIYSKFGVELQKIPGNFHNKLFSMDAARFLHAQEQIAEFEKVWTNKTIHL